MRPSVLHRFLALTITQIGVVFLLDYSDTIVAKCPKCDVYSCSVQSNQSISNDLNQSIPADRCRIIKDTYQCEQYFRALPSSVRHGNEEHNVDWSICPPGLFTLSVQPYIWREPTFTCLPRAQANISVVVHSGHPVLNGDPVSVQITWECLQSSLRDANNRVTCRQSGTRPRHWEKDYWPCRGFVFDEALIGGSVDRPNLTVSYGCKQLNESTLYRLNVTVYPLRCRSAYFFSVGNPNQFLPDLPLQRPPKVDWADWLPLLVLDTNQRDRVTLLISRMPEDPKFTLAGYRIQLLLNDEADDRPPRQLSDQNIAAASEWHSWHALPQGNYTVKLIVLHTHCESNQAACPSSLAHFVLPVDLQGADSRFHWLLWLFATFVLLCLLTACALTCMFVAGRTRKAQQANGHIIEHIELTLRKKVLLLYTDDSAEHRACVRALATWLQAQAHCTVLLDEWALHSGSVGAHEWLLQSLRQADVFVIVFSEGTRLALQGLHIGTTLPFGDLFPIAFTYVMQCMFNDCRERSIQSNTKLSRYVIARFSYSPPSVIDPVLGALPLQSVCIPDDLPTLMCHVHQDRVNDSHSQSAECSVLLVNQSAHDTLKQLVQQTVPADTDALLRRAQNITNTNRETLIGQGQTDWTNQQTDGGTVGVTVPVLGVQQAYHLLRGLNEGQGNYELVPPNREEQDEDKYALLGGLEDVPDSDED